MTTKAKIEKYLNIEINSSQDTAVDFWIAAVTKYIQRACKRTFALNSTDYAEVYKGSGTNYLNLKNYPITAITKIERNDNLVGEPVWTEIDADYYYIKADQGQVYYYGGFFKAEAEYKVSYKAGYASIPDDISLVATALVGEIIKNHSGLTRGTQSEGLGEYSISFDAITPTLPDTLKAILNSYRTPTI